MAVNQYRSKRKPSGGRYKKLTVRRKHQLGNLPTHTKIEKRSVNQARGLGGNIKTKLLSENSCNLFDPKTKKHIKAKVLNVVENPANPHFVRRNILTKGAVIETDKGKARVTSRPGQEGTINAVLV